MTADNAALADCGRAVLLVRAPLLDLVQRVLTWLYCLVLLVAYEVVHLLHALPRLNRLELFLVRVTHRLFRLSCLDARSLLLRLWLVKLAEVEQGNVDLIRGRHRPLAIVDHAIAGHLYAPWAIPVALVTALLVLLYSAAAFDRGGVVMNLANLVHR